VKRTRYCFVLACCMLVSATAGCGHKLPPEVVEKVTWKGDFKTLQANPEAYIDEFVILGGKIIHTRTFQDRSEITVLQFPTDHANRPQPQRESGGRFLIRSGSLIDPEIYPPGKLVTVAGTIIGVEHRPIGEYPYEHPVLEGDLWVWEPRETALPRFHFGVGIGKTF
jgi:outer membrane lipoprotein